MNSREKGTRFCDEPENFVPNSSFFDPLADETILNIFRSIEYEYPGERYDVLKIFMLVSKRFNRLALDNSLWMPLVKSMTGELRLKSDVPIHKQIRFVHLRAKEFKYPFDQLIARIEREVDERVVKALNWRLEYWYLARKTCVFRQLSILEGENFHLFFSRFQGEQGELEGYVNLAGGVNSIAIPKLQIHTQSNFENGLAVYIGDQNQWEQDKKEFLTRSIWYDDNRQLPQYLYYYPCSHNDPDRLQTFEYGVPSQYFTRSGRMREIPIGQPHFYERDKVYEQVTKFLEEEILRPIIRIKAEILSKENSGK